MTWTENTHGIVFCSESKDMPMPYGYLIATRTQMGTRSKESK
ncbi:hypothetical protein SP21_37 [Salmonella phage 21]|nr:hypothetical protein SP21_37 [Salmonella phage 21]